MQFQKLLAFHWHFSENPAQADARAVPRDRDSTVKPHRPTSGKSAHSRVLRVLWRVLETPVVLILVLLVLPVILVFLPVHLLRRRSRIRRFHRRYQYRLILVWHSRRGWHDFCLNNLLPALPEGTIVMHDDRFNHPPERLNRREVEQQARLRPPRRPYLLYSDAGKLRMLSLNRALQPLKRRAKRDPVVRAEVAAAIDDAIGRSGFGPAPSWPGPPAGADR